MSAITATAYDSYKLTDRQEFAAITPVWNGFQTNSDQLTNYIPFSRFNGGAAVSSGTVATSTTQPIVARKYTNNGSIFQYGVAGRPAAAISSFGQTVTATGSGSGRTFTGVSFSVPGGDFICLVAKPSTAVTLTFVLRSGANERVFAFTTSSFTADSNGYVRFVAPNATGTYTGVTVTTTGTVTDTTVFSEIEVRASGSAVIDCDNLMWATNVEALIGHQLTLGFDCIDELSWEETLETADRKCFNYTTGKTPTDKGITLTVKYNDLQMKIEAAARGEVIKNGAGFIPVIQNASAGALTSLAISAGALTITGLVATQIMSVSVSGGKVLDRVESAAMVNATTYHYNSSTGAFTFSTLYNGAIPTIVYNTAATVDYFDNKNLKTGFVGNMTVTRTAADGTKMIYIFPSVELTKITPEQGDSQVSHTVELTAIPFKDGQDWRFFRQIKA